MYGVVDNVIGRRREVRGATVCIVCLYADASVNVTRDLKGVLTVLYIQSGFAMDVILAVDQAHETGGQAVKLTWLHLEGNEAIWEALDTIQANVPKYLTSQLKKLKPTKTVDSRCAVN